MPATQPKTRTEQILEKNTILQKIVKTLQTQNQQAREEINGNHLKAAIKRLTTTGNVVAELQQQAKKAFDGDLTKSSLKKRTTTKDAFNDLKALTAAITNLTKEMQRLLLLANQKSDLIEAHYAHQLTLLEKSKPKDAIKGHLDKVLEQVKLMKESDEEKVETLTRILQETNLMLNSEPGAIEYYKNIAEQVQGKSSPAMKILGGLMVALGIEAQYNEQLDLLETFQLEDASPVKPHLEKVLAQVKLMKKSGGEEVETLTRILQETNSMLKSEPGAIEYYKNFAEQVQGKSSPAMKILGGLMVALGTVMMAIGAVTGVVPAMVGGGALAAAGIGFFAYGKQSGLAKTMDNLAEAQTVQESTQGLRA